MRIEIDTTKDGFATALAAIYTAYEQPIPSALRHPINRREAEAGVLAVAPEKGLGVPSIEDVEVAARMVAQMSDRRPWVGTVLEKLARHGRVDLRELARDAGSDSHRGVAIGIAPLRHAGGEKGWVGLPITWTEKNAVGTIEPGLRAALAKAIGLDDVLD